MTKKESTISKGSDGKTWVMPEAKPKAEKKGKKGKSATKTRVEKKSTKRTPVLSSLDVAPTDLVATYKGTEHKGTVNPDGTITVNGKTFNSPSRAGKEITGREVDGWTFWYYKKEDGTHEKINELRKGVGK